MKIIYSHIEVEFRQAVENEAQRHIVKLNRLLKRYAPDLVVLHCSLEKTPRKTEYNIAVNLALPTGTLHALGAGGDVRGGVKVAFAELETQVTKHQEKLRKDYMWKRKRARPLSNAGEAAD
jgi:ribosome-associated translation inhibitor RaiA